MVFFLGGGVLCDLLRQHVSASGNYSGRLVGQLLHVSPVLFIHVLYLVNVIYSLSCILLCLFIYLFLVNLQYISAYIPRTKVLCLLTAVMNYTMCNSYLVCLLLVYMYYSNSKIKMRLGKKFFSSQRMTIVFTSQFRQQCFSQISIEQIPILRPHSIGLVN